MNKSDPSQNDSTAKVIALLPRDDDPVREIASGDHPHVTLFYLGDGETDRNELHKLVKAAADTGYQHPDPYDQIGGEGILGNEGAYVYLLDARFSDSVRSLMEGDPWLQEELQKVEQFPVWNPHITLGYPDAPADIPNERPDGVVYDRIAIFDAGEVTEYPFDFEESEESMTASAATEISEEEDEDLKAAIAELQDSEAEFEVPVHGVLAPEGVASSDGRMFAENAMTTRSLPLPLRWTPADVGKHDGAVIVGRIDEVFREDGKIIFNGVFDTSENAYESVRLIANGMLRGVSVDVSDVVMAETDDEDVTVFESVQLAAATLVAVPAFPEAYVALGHWSDENDPKVQEDDEEDEEFAISEDSWNGSPSRFTLEEYHASCIIHLHDGAPESKNDCKLPIKEPNGDLSRAGVKAAAGRINQTDAPDEQISKAKKSLRSAYKQLSEDPPEVVQAAGDSEEFDKVTPRHMDGPGWITHPRPTKRITGYWVNGKGAAKIRWGQGGDFNRCRRQLVKYVRNPSWLAGLCANLHHRALGIWPGQHSLSENIIASATPAVSITASAGKPLPAEWFADPKLDRPTPFTVTEDGRVFGHVASWDTCHIGYSDQCTTAPASKSNYAYFKTGEVDTTGGPVSVGQIVMGGPHADPRAQMRAAFVHYASTSSALADVNVGEDAHGIWVAGALREGISDDDLRTLKASGLSGDWRTVRAGGTANMELVAALAVNVQGFPIPRTSLAASASGPISMTAAGVVVEDDRQAKLDRARSTMRSHRITRLKDSLRV